MWSCLRNRLLQMFYLTDNSTLILTSKGFQPFKNGMVMTPWRCASSVITNRFNTCDGFTFHVQINGGISVRCIEIRMSQPLTYRRDI